MNSQEFERGKLITDWSTVKQGDLIISCINKCDSVLLKFLGKYEDNFFVIDICSSGISPTVWRIHEAYYAIPKKKKVIRYLYGYVSGDGIYNIIARQWFKDDHDYINNAKIISDVFHRLDWTAKEFDE